MPHDTGQPVSPKRQSAGDWSRLAKTYAPGMAVAPHAHSAGQLLFITQGVLLVETAQARWTVPPQQALWLPPGEVHAFHAASRTVLRALYLGTPWLKSAEPRFVRCGTVHAIAVTPLLKELVLGLFDPQWDTTTQRSMLRLVISLLPSMALLPTDLPMPSSERLRLAAMAVLTESAWDQPVSAVADMAHMSERSFTRHFKAELGVSFRAWRQRARLIVSLDGLSAGHSVKQVAHAMGFASSAAYVAAFHAVLGCPPGALVGGSVVSKSGLILNNGLSSRILAESIGQ